MRTHFLQHVPFEGPAAIGHWTVSRRHKISATRLWENPVFPKEWEYDALVVMGGPMNADEEKKYPWLREEKKFIDGAVRTGKKVLGVCLGAQLIARVLGSRVYKNSHKEIGWLPVVWQPAAASLGVNEPLPGRQVVFQWHGDTFDLPHGAELIASSEACVNQAFLYDGRVLGLQFHLESTRESIGLLVENCGKELRPAPYIQSRDSIVRNAAHYASNAAVLGRILNGLLR